MTVKHRKLLAGVLAKTLPYKPLLYIENIEGDSHIDTGIKPSSSPSVILDLEQNADRIICHGFSNSYAGQLIRSVNLENTTKYVYTLGDQWVASLVTTDATQRQIIEYNYVHDIKTSTLKVGDQITQKEQTNQTSDSPWNTSNFHLFKSRADNWGTQGYGRLYSCKIYINNVIVRDFVPCMLLEDNRIGLWDKVNEIFYGNKGTIPFTYGEL